MKTSWGNLHICWQFISLVCMRILVIIAIMKISHSCGLLSGEDADSGRPDELHVSAAELGRQDQLWAAGGARGPRAGREGVPAGHWQVLCESDYKFFTNMSILPQILLSSERSCCIQCEKNTINKSKLFLFRTTWIRTARRRLSAVRWNAWCF